MACSILLLMLSSSPKTGDAFVVVPLSYDALSIMTSRRSSKRKRIQPFPRISAPNSRVSAGYITTSISSTRTRIKTRHTNTISSTQLHMSLENFAKKVVKLNSELSEKEKNLESSRYDWLKQSKNLKDRLDEMKNILTLDPAGYKEQAKELARNIEAFEELKLDLQNEQVRLEREVELLQNEIVCFQNLYRTEQRKAQVLERRMLEADEERFNLRRSLEAQTRQSQQLQQRLYLQEQQQRETQQEQTRQREQLQRQLQLQEEQFLNEQRRQAQQYGDEKTALFETIRDLQTKLSDQEEAAMEQQDDMQNLETENAQLNKSLNQKDEEIQELQSQLRDQEQDVDRKSKKVQYIERENEQLQNTLNQQAKEIEKLQSQITEQEWLTKEEVEEHWQEVERLQLKLQEQEELIKSQSFDHSSESIQKAHHGSKTTNNKRSANVIVNEKRLQQRKNGTHQPNQNGLKQPSEQKFIKKSDSESGEMSGDLNSTKKASGNSS